MERKIYLISVPRELPKEEQYRTIKEIGYAGVEAFSGKLTKERFDELAEYGLELTHGGLTYDENGNVDEEYVQLLKEHNIDEIAMSFAPSNGQRAPFPRNMGNLDEGRYYGLPGGATYDKMMALAEQWSKEAEIAGRYGFKVHYHNHTHEFRQANYEYLMDIFLKNTPDNVVMELDAGWTIVAGIDTASWMRKWKGRIGSMHLKAACWALGPEGNGHMCPLPPYDKIGYSLREFNAREDFGKAPQGPMRYSCADYTEILRAAEEVGCAQYIIERERYYLDDKVQCLREDFDYIKECFAKLG